MAVTDLTDSLPWWARQGGGPTGTPSATPQGGPPAGVSSQDWMNYLQQMFGQSGGQVGPPQPLGGATPLTPAGQPLPPGGSGTGSLLGSLSPISSAAAAEAPTLLHPALQGQQLLHPLLGSVTNAQQQPPPVYNPLSGGSANTGVPVRGAPPQPSFNPLAGGSANTGQPPGYGPPPQPAYNPLADGSANTGQPPVAAAPPQTMPWRGPIAGDSPANIAAAGGGAPAPARGPMAANSRFIGIDRPNAPAEGGPYGRSGLQGTALNLAGMFGGAPAAARAPAAAAAAAPVPGPLANAPMPPVMPPDVRNKRLATAVRSPNWW